MTMPPNFMQSTGSRYTASTDAFALAERQRSLAAAEAERAFLAVDESGVCLGFAALDSLDGEPYLDQLAVQRAFMRRGVGQLLLEQAVAWAERQKGDALRLTTYAHLPFNRPYYERHGFVVVAEVECGSGIRHHLEEQRRALPTPSERVAMRRSLRPCGEVAPNGRT
jgi:GNAT superfamily N-acetyltransferase